VINIYTVTCQHVVLYLYILAYWNRFRYAHYSFVYRLGKYKPFLSFYTLLVGTRSTVSTKFFVYSSNTFPQSMQY
jgi:hypothetical protein